jgi:transcriptional regulator with XRE-family HTH domain
MTSIIPELVALRKSQGITQYALAKRMGVHQTSLRQWELGTYTPAATVLPKWADALGYELVLHPKSQS